MTIARKSNIIVIAQQILHGFHNTSSSPLHNFRRTMDCAHPSMCQKCHLTSMDGTALTIQKDAWWNRKDELRSAMRI